MTQDDKPLLDRFIDRHPKFPCFFNASLGILLTLIGSITIFHLLTTPTVRDPESEHSATCYPVSQWRSVPDDIDVSMDQGGSLTRDQCVHVRENRIATAIFVAVPTTIVGSVTATAIVFRRRLGPETGAAHNAKD